MARQIDITGPTTVEHGENEIWTATVSGDGCVNNWKYDWFYKQYPHLPWTNGQSVTKGHGSDNYSYVHFITGCSDRFIPNTVRKLYFGGVSF